MPRYIGLGGVSSAAAAARSSTPPPRCGRGGGGAMAEQQFGGRNWEGHSSLLYVDEGQNSSRKGEWMIE